MSAARDRGSQSVSGPVHHRRGPRATYTTQRNTRRAVTVRRAVQTLIPECSRARAHHYRVRFVRTQPSAVVFRARSHSTPTPYVYVTTGCREYTCDVLRLAFGQLRVKIRNVIERQTAAAAAR